MSLVNQQRLYSEEVYTVRPDMYAPIAIDAVATFLTQTFGIPTPPDPGIVRHILSDASSGLHRFLGSISIPDYQKDTTVVDQHIRTIKSVVEASLQQHQAEIDAQKPKYEGVRASEKFPFTPDDNQAMLLWAIDTVARIASEEGDIEVVVSEIEQTIMSDLGKNHEALRHDFNTFVRVGITQGRSRQVLAYGMLSLFNHRYLIPRGQFISPAGSVREEGNEDENEEEEVLAMCEIIDIDLFETVIGEVPVLTVVEPKNQRRFISTPYYDLVNKVVVIPISYMLHEARMILAHKSSIGMQKRVSRHSGDYRYGKASKRYYTSLWEGVGTDQQASEIQQALSGNGLQRHEKWEKIKNYPAMQNLLSCILSEELRHGIDESVIRSRTEGMNDQELKSFGLYSNALTNPEGILRTEFQEKTSGMTLEQQRMMNNVVLEFIGKTVQISAGISPKIGIAHVLHTLESSRLLMPSNRHSFRDELKYANQPSKNMKTWPHAMACRMIAVRLGGYFGYTNAQFNMDGVIDDVELVKALERLQRLSDDELRLAIRNTMKGELVVPIDSKPFPAIQDNGSLDLDSYSLE